MNEQHPIAVLTTGGTIDKIYFDSLSAFQIQDSVIGHLLRVACVTYPYTVTEVCRKDSLELNDDDRAMIVAQVKATTGNRVVITHGTDTMTVTAAALCVISGKTIILVGALTPARFSESDATFNLGMAFAAAQIAPPGVYITMNGTVFDAASVVKDRAAGAFIACEIIET